MAWQKGQSGNPEGPQSRKPWRDALRKVGAQHAPGKRSGPKRLETVAKQCFSEAEGGNMAAAKEIGDRLDGKAIQGLELDVAVTVTAIERTIVDPKLVGPVIDVVAEDDD